MPELKSLPPEFALLKRIGNYLTEYFQDSFKPQVARTTDLSTIESTQKEEKKKEEEEHPKPFISTPLSMSFSFQPTQNSNGNTSGSAPGKTTDQPKTGSLSLFFS